MGSATGATGDIGVTIVRPYTFASGTIVGASASRDLISRYPGPVNILTGACLFLYFLAATTTGPDVHACLTMADR